MGLVTRPLESVNVLLALLETTVPVSLHLSLCLSLSLSLFSSLSFSLSDIMAVFVVCDVSPLCQLRSCCSFVLGPFRLVSDWSIVLVRAVMCCAVSVHSL